MASSAQWSITVPSGGTAAVRTRLARAPRELVTRGATGHVAAFVPGVALSDAFGQCAADRLIGLSVGVALAPALDALERQGLAHGDLSPANVHVQIDALSVARVALIDFDNVRAPLGDQPPVIGTPLYMAPELYEGRVRPNLESDRFAAAVLLHHILLGRHPAEAFMRAGAPTVSQAAVLARNDWVHADEHELVGGLPAETLSATLRRMLRRGLASDPGVRTRAIEWKRELRRALDDLWECPRCEIATVNDTRRGDCPNCGEQATEHELVLDDGRRVRLARPATRVGRALLGAPDVSHEHGIFEWRGYELRICDISRNGTALKHGSAWKPLPRGKAIEVRVGDRLCFARQVKGTIK